MSEIWEDLLSGENESLISVIQELTDESKIDFTTQIDNPVIFTVLEIIANNINTKYKVEDLAVFVLLFKKYMIPYKRKRTEELLKAITGAEKGEDQSEAIKKLFGELVK